MFDSHPGKFSKTRGKCLFANFQKLEEIVRSSVWQIGRKMSPVISANFKKKKENVRPSFWQIFIYRRKMSNSHSNVFSNLGGKSRVSVQGVESLWGDCRFIPADWGSQYHYGRFGVRLFIINLQVLAILNRLLHLSYGYSGPILLKKRSQGHIKAKKKIQFKSVKKV